MIGAEAVVLSPRKDGDGHHSLMIRTSDVDSYGNGLNFKMISLSIDGGPKVIMTRNQLVDVVDAILSMAEEATNV